ncbi:hypothetical protein PHET_05612 [Paragonimus heterotremus]|uniref:Uncharacterized protein n=1 Tax=Paragonimus heterotremus TaxID=100268 RepID=A0A8J4SPH9_9TREM|nr:hypothetical protein PHET_05612 [Paragonimus heterotremus]
MNYNIQLHGIRSDDETVLLVQRHVLEALSVHTDGGIHVASWDPSALPMYSSFVFYLEDESGTVQHFTLPVNVTQLPLIPRGMMYFYGKTAGKLHLLDKLLVD